MQKTKRVANFSSAEISTIISLVKKKKFYNVIESKKTDTVTNRNKDEAWRVLAEEFNSISRKIYRDAKSLRGKYTNTKNKQNINTLKKSAGRDITSEIVRRDEDVQTQERRMKIREGRFNEKYKVLVTEDLPRYLNGMGNIQSKRIVARFRVGNEENDNKYWLEEEKRLCRLCGEERENIEHLAENCGELKEHEGGWRGLLGEDGMGKKWMEEVLECRRRKGGY
ncbi:hypothetical protein RI129_009495 [Pyrocoelia pectoralis]|uniref:Regulatory protein zeste n=1 Tax=Pyrocoelia pectoralis TaxID=417401 RepID=A0AAN7V666_9COLE